MNLFNLLKIEDIDLDKTFASNHPEITKQAVNKQSIISIVGLIISSAAILVGGILFLVGITLGTTWTVELAGIKSEMTDAPAGTVLVFSGIVIGWLTRFSVKIK